MSTSSGVTPLARPRELDLLPTDRSAVIEASAGTGKTYLLEHLVLELIITGRARLEEILIVTFTERATAELLARVRRKLDQALATRAPAVAGGGETWTIDDGARTRLAAARRSFDQATIATIHAFCQRVLADEPLATGRLMAQTQVDGRRVFGEAFRDVLRHTLATHRAHRPYLDAFLTCGGSVDRLEELLYRASTGRASWAIPYREAEVADMAARLLDLEPRLAAQSLALRQVLRTQKAVTTLQPRLQALAARARDLAQSRDWTQLLVMLDQFANVTFFPYLETIEGSGVSPPALDDLRRLASELLDLPCLDEAVAQRFLPLVEEALAARKLREGWTDYDDMIHAVDAALHGDSGAALVKKLRARYRFALVDEAQDTEPAQWRIFRRVFLDSGSSNPVALIGDPKQAIYGFRGADVRTYVAARADIQARGGTLLRLSRSFRSRPEVQDAVNAILDHEARPRYFSEGDIAYDEPAQSELGRLGPGQAGVTLLRAEPDAELGRPARVGEIKRALRRAIVEEIVRLRDGAPDLRLREIFVLTRSNAEAVEIASDLRAAGIAHALYKPDRLFATKEAADIRALLCALGAPTDRVARMHAWLTPFFDVNLRELAALGTPPADHPLVARLAAWKALADARAFGELWARILDDSGVTRRLRMLPSGQRRLANYRQLFDWLLGEVAERPSSVLDLTAALASRAATLGSAAGEEDHTQRAETEDDAIQIMTVHKAKGLEADAVFLYGGLTRQRSWRRQVQTFHVGSDRRSCVGKPRRQRSLDQIDSYRREEDQRLLYVAMTRARRWLYLPFFPNAGSASSDATHESDLEVFKAITGEYSQVNARLCVLGEPGRLAAGFRARSFSVPAPADEDTAALEAALGRVEIEAGAAATEAAAAEAAGAERDDAARLRADRRGFLITSYSRLKEARGGYAPPAAAEPGDAELAAAVEREAGRELDARIEAEPETGSEAASAAPGDPAGIVAALGVAALGPGDAADDALPGGVASGLFLHAVLERVALGELPPFDEWRQRPDVLAVLEGELRRWDRDRRHLVAAARLAHAALTAPIPMPDGSTLPGIARAARARREVGFLFPLPDRRTLARPSPHLDVARVAREAGHGFVRGTLDVLFEHQGRVCFADWKSDVLPAFDATAIREHVAANYRLQVQIYTLALIRMLGIDDASEHERRFGGLAYIFVRGLDNAGDRRPHDAIHVERPSWDEVLRWDRELASISTAPSVGSHL